MTEREHYVPQFYLRYFTNTKGMIVTYDFDKKRFFPAPPNDVCFCNNLYETPFEEANEKLGEYVVQNDIEKTFGGYESKFAALLKAISQRCVPYQNKNALILSSEEKDTLCSFLVNMLVRNPHNMEQMKLDELDDAFIHSDFYIGLKDILDKMNIGGTKSVCIAAQKKAMITTEYDGSMPCIMAKELRKIIFTFYYANEEEFITSDNPVCYGTDNLLSNPNDTCLYCALTPKVAVVFGNYSNSRYYRNKMVPIKKKTVDYFNQEIIKKKHYSRFVFATNESALQRYIEQEI